MLHWTFLEWWLRVFFYAATWYGGYVAADELPGLQFRYVT